MGFQGMPFYPAVKEAQQRLQGLEGEFPCASWLPVIYQDPTAIAPTWELSASKNRLSQILKKTVLTSFSATVFIFCLRMLSLLQSAELATFDHFLRWRPFETPDSRLLIVQATPEDIDREPETMRHRASLSNNTISLLLEKLADYDPISIGLDIYRPFPAGSPKLKQQLQEHNTFGICKVRDSEAGDPTGEAPSPEISPERLGFVDAVIDRDKILRRQLLSLNVSDLTDTCSTTNNLSFLLVLHYLNSQHQIQLNWQRETNDRYRLQLGDTILPQLTPGRLLGGLDGQTGAYQPSELGGRQILLNYRTLAKNTAIASTVSVGDILQDKITPSKRHQLKHRIVLIGIADSTARSQDYWYVPYGQSQQIATGVSLQAQMVSQLLSAVLDHRPLLRVMPRWGEGLWILAWSGIASLWFWRKPSVSRQNWVWFGGSCFALYGISHLLFLRGLWSPLVPTFLAMAIAAGLMAVLGKNRVK